EKSVILAVPFWMDFCGNIYYLALPLLVIELGGTPVQLGLVGTVASSVYMVMALLTGRLSDRFGRRALMVAGPLAFACACLLMTQAGGIPTILALAALNGISFSLFWPAFQAWVAEVQAAAKDLARNIGNFNLSWTSSQLVGAIVAGLLFAVSPRLPFFAAAGFGLALFLFLLANVKDRTLPSTRETGPADLPGESGNHRFFLYAIWVSNFATWFILGNVRYQFPKLAREMAVSPQTIGLLISCVGLSQFLGFFFLRLTDRWHFNRDFLFGAQLVSAAGLMIMVFATGAFSLAPALVLIGVSASLTYYSSLYYAVLLLARKGKGTGIHESILGCGVVFGPLLGGVAAQFGGLRSPYLLCAGVLLAAMAVELFLIRRDNPLAASPIPLPRPGGED
ncbi:MAG TPA: MFS transporter, partial [Thermodesulfobacteriota bacterium]|nr:MFS transporter [Thermodesulfobacteriota bacterium]